MKKRILQWSWVFTALGFAMILVGFPTHLTDYNSYIFVSLAFIVAGAVIWVVGKKHDSRY